MLCLEIMAGKQPFSNLSRNVNVIYNITNGVLPERPGPLATSRGLSQDLWVLMLRCWLQRPDTRPSMPEIKSILEGLRDTLPPLLQGQIYAIDELGIYLTLPSQQIWVQVHRPPLRI
jgi:hypothetical protein